MNNNDITYKTSNKFTKATIWVILILLSLALVLPSVLPLFNTQEPTNSTQQISINDIVTQVSSSEVEKQNAENTKNIEAQAEENLKKSSEEIAR